MAQHLAAISISLSLSCLLASAVSAAGLTPEALRNLSVKVPDLMGDGTHAVEFKQGECKNGSGVDKIVATAVGDLDGDGVDDGAIVFYENWGGTGDFMGLCVFLCKDGKPDQIAYRTLGDRSQTRVLKIEKRKLKLDIMTHAASDPASAPTVNRMIEFTVRDGKFMGVDDIN